MVGLPFLAFGQDAAIVGTVTDPAGQVVPNVTVTITNTDTAKIRVVTTSESGQYAADALEIGHYKVVAEITGFKIAERQNITLNVTQRERIDFQLAIGTTAESISVEGDAVAVQADSGEQSSLLTGQQLTQLQTNGRSIYNVVNLTTDSASLQSDFQVPTPVGGNANVSFNGNRMGHNIYLLDGGENLDRGGSGTFQRHAFARRTFRNSDPDIQLQRTIWSLFRCNDHDRCAVWNQRLPRIGLGILAE